uniref:Uncharacterized protein n=1 Tax=Klebsiella phage FKP3 TaxID=3231233 RepID=A0AAU8I004_9CAUD
MGDMIFKVDFIRYDEDMISAISGYTRYFKDPVKANEEAGKWISKSNRNEVITNVVEVE